jgi:putative aldouronate transport system substrate-binding protein
MKKNIRILSLIIGATLSVSTMAACSTSKKTNGQGDAAPSKETKAPLEFSYMAGISEPHASATDNAVLKELEKRGNVKINYIWVPAGNFNDKVTTTLASGDIPEVINGATSMLLNQGAIVPIDDVLKTNGKNILSRFTPDQYAFLRQPIDGKIYGIPTIVDLPYSFSWIIREDWLKTAGITKEPQTWDEWKAMWRAFKEKDVRQDGGKGEKLPYVGDIYSLMPVFGMNVANRQGFMADGSKYMLAYDHANFPKYLDEMRALYKEGLLDPEFATRGTWTNKGNALDDALNAGLGGSWVSWAAGARDIAVILQKTNPNASLKAVLPPKSPIDGSQRIAGRNKLYGSANFTITAQKNGKLKDIISYYDYVYSDEGVKISSYGMEGTQSKTENGKTTILSPYVDNFTNARKSGINFTPSPHLFTNDAYMQIALTGKSVDKLDGPTTQFYNGLVKNDPFLFAPVPIFQTTAYVEKQAQIMPKIESLLVECVIGKISTEEFFKQYNALKPQGLKDIIDQAQAAYTKVAATK